MEKLQKLHGLLESEGYEPGDFETFVATYSDPVRQEKLHKLLETEGYEPEPIDKFRQTYFSATPAVVDQKKKTTPSQGVGSPVSQPQSKTASVVTPQSKPAVSPAKPTYLYGQEKEVVTPAAGENTPIQGLGGAPMALPRVEWKLMTKAEAPTLSHSKKILEANKDKQWVDRVMNPSKYPSIKGKNGEDMTHRLSYAEQDGKFYVFPEIQYDPKTGKLNDYTDREKYGWTAMDKALESGEAIEFKTEKEAADFTQNYKKGTPLEAMYGGPQPLQKEKEQANGMKEMFQKFQDYRNQATIAAQKNTMDEAAGNIEYKKSQRDPNPDWAEQQKYALEDAQAAERAKVVSTQPLVSKMLDYYDAKAGDTEWEDNRLVKALSYTSPPAAILAGGPGGMFAGDRDDSPVVALKEQLVGTPEGAALEQELQKIYKRTNLKDQTSVDNALLDAKQLMFEKLADKDVAIWDDFAQTNKAMADYNPQAYHKRIESQIEKKYGMAGMDKDVAYNKLMDYSLNRGVMDEERTAEAKAVLNLRTLKDEVSRAEREGSVFRIDQAKQKLAAAEKEVQGMESKRLSALDKRVEIIQDLIVNETDQEKIGLLKKDLDLAKAQRAGFINPNAQVMATYAKFQDQANAVAPKGTPMEKLQKLYAELEFDRQQIMGRIQQAEAKGGALGFAAQEMINSVGGQGHNDDHKRLVQIESQIKDLAPIVFLNENPIAQDKKQGFFPAFNTGLMSSLAGQGSPLSNTQRQEDALSLARNLQLAGVTPEALNDPTMLGIKDRMEEPGLFSGEYLGQLSGQSTGLMASIMATTALTKGVGLGAAINRAVTWGNKALGLTGKYSGAILPLLGDAIESGINYEGAGRISVDNNDELDFVGGFLGGAAASVGSSGFNALKSSVAKFFGDKAQDAAKLIANFGASRVGSGVGETFEEFGQQIGQTWEASSTGQEFWKRMEDQFGSVDKSTKFIVSTMLMGAFMGGAHSGGLGEYLTNYAQEQLDALPPEQREITQERIDQIQDEQAAFVEGGLNPTPEDVASVEAEQEGIEPEKKKQELKPEAQAAQAELERRAAIDKTMVEQGLGDRVNTAQSQEDRIREELASLRDQRTRQHLTANEMKRLEDLKVIVDGLDQIAAGEQFVSPAPEVQTETVTTNSGDVIEAVEGSPTKKKVTLESGIDLEIDTDGLSELLGDGAQSVIEQSFAPTEEVVSVEETPASPVAEENPFGEPTPREQPKRRDQQIVEQINEFFNNLAGAIGENAVAKIKEYADRVIADPKARESIIKGLPKKWIDSIDEAVVLQQQAAPATDESIIDVTEEAPTPIAAEERNNTEGHKSLNDFLSNELGETQDWVSDLPIGVENWTDAELEQYPITKAYKKFKQETGLSPKIESSNKSSVVAESPAPVTQKKGKGAANGGKSKPKANPNRRTKSKPVADLTPTEVVSEAIAVSAEVDENPTTENKEREAQIEERIENNVISPAADNAPVVVTKEETQLAEELEITPKEVQNAKKGDEKRTRKSKAVVEAIESQAADAIASGDPTAAEEVLAAIEGAESAILGNVETNDNFQDKYGVSEVELANEYNSLGKNATIEQAYKNVTGNTLTSKTDGDIDKYKEFVTDFLNALPRAGIKLKKPLEVGQDIVIDVTPIPVKPVKKTGVDATNSNVHSDQDKAALTGIYFDGDQMVATDANQLVVIRIKESATSIIEKFKAAIVKARSKALGLKGAQAEAERVGATLTEEGLDGKILNFNGGTVVDQRYPDYKSVIPAEDAAQSKPIPIQQLIDVVNGAAITLKNLAKDSYQRPIFVIRLSGEMDLDLGINPELLLRNLQTLQANGATSVVLGATKANRGVNIYANNGNRGLVMPIMLGKVDQETVITTNPYEINTVAPKNQSNKQTVKESAVTEETETVYVVDGKEVLSKLKRSNPLTTNGVADGVRLDSAIEAIPDNKTEGAKKLIEKIKGIANKVTLQRKEGGNGATVEFVDWNSLKSLLESEEAAARGKQKPLPEGAQTAFHEARISGERVSWMKKDGKWYYRTHKDGTKISEGKFKEDWQEATGEQIAKAEKLAAMNPLDLSVVNSTKEWIAAWKDLVTLKWGMSGAALSRVDLGLADPIGKIMVQTVKLGVAVAKQLAAKGAYTKANWEEAMKKFAGDHVQPLLSSAWETIQAAFPEGSSIEQIEAVEEQAGEEAEETKPKKKKEPVEDSGEKTGTQKLMEKYISKAGEVLAKVIANSPMLKSVYDQKAQYEKALKEVKEAIAANKVGQLMARLMEASTTDTVDVDQFQRMILVDMYSSLTDNATEVRNRAAVTGDKAAEKQAQKDIDRFTTNTTSMLNAMNANALGAGRGGAASGMWRFIGGSMDTYAMGVIDKANRAIAKSKKTANGKTLEETSKEIADNLNEEKKKKANEIADSVDGAIDNGVNQSKPKRKSSTIAGKTAAEFAELKRQAKEKYDSIRLGGTMNAILSPNGFAKTAAAAEFGYYALLEGAVTFKDWVASMKKDLPDLTDQELADIWDSELNGRTLSEESKNVLREKALKSINSALYSSERAVENTDSAKETKKLRDQMAKDLAATIEAGESIDDFKKKYGLTDEQAEDLSESIAKADQAAIDKLAGKKVKGFDPKAYLPKPKGPASTDAQKADAKKKAETRVKVKEVIRDHFANPDGQPLIDKLTEAGLDLEQAQKVEQAVRDNAQVILAQAVAGELDHIQSGESKRKNRDYKPPKKGGKKRTNAEILIDNLVDGNITDRFVQGLVRHKFGMGRTATAEEVTRLRKLGKAVKEAQAGSVFEKMAMKELATLIDSMMPKTMTEDLSALLNGLIMSSVLNSVSTILVNPYSVTDHWILGAVKSLIDPQQWMDLFNALTKKDGGNPALLNPLAKILTKMMAGHKPTLSAIESFTSGMVTGTTSGKYDESVMDSDPSKMLPALEREQRTAFGRAITAPKWWNPYSHIFGKTIGRILSATDAGMTMAYGDLEFLDALRVAIGKKPNGSIAELKALAGEYLSQKSQLWQDSLQQAKDEAAAMEALTGKHVPDITVEVRAREIVRKKFASDPRVMLDESEMASIQKVAQYNTLTLKRQGGFGKAATVMAKLKSGDEKWQKALALILKPFILFTEIPGNYGDALLDNTPIYSIFRALGISPTGLAQRAGWTETSAAIGEWGSRERRKQLEQAFFSNVLFIAAYALIGMDDDDDDVTGKQINTDESYQLFGIPYKAFASLAPSLIFARVLRDSEKDPKFKTMSAPEAGFMRMTSAMTALSGFYTDQSFMKGIQDFGRLATTLAEFSKGETTTQAAFRAVIRPYLNLATKPLPQTQGVTKFILDCFDPHKYTEEDWSEMFAMTIGMERINNEKKIGLFGEEYLQYPGYNVLNVKSLIDKAAGDHPMKRQYEFLARTKTFIKAPTNPVAKFLDPKSSTGFTFREFTPNEWYKLNKKAGEYFLKDLNTYMNSKGVSLGGKIDVANNKLISQTQTDILKKWSDARSKAKKELFGKILLSDTEAQKLLNENFPENK